MGRRRIAGTGPGGGELISTLRPARRGRVAIAATAVALDIALGALVATDAGTAGVLAWDATAISIVILAVGLTVGSSTAVHASVALLGALLLVRQENRLVLAAVYGACLLLVAELAQRSFEMRVERLGSGVIAARLTVILLLAALGACSGAVAAIAVTIAPVRSLAFTAVGMVALLAAFAGIVLLARRHAPENRLAGTDRPAAPKR